MNLKKTFPIAVIVLAILIIAIVLVVLYQDGTLKLGSKQEQTTSAAVVELISDNGKISERAIADFEAFIKETDQPVFVDFWAEWCPPCKAAAPFIEELAVTYDGKAHVVKINVDLANDLAIRYGAQSIPQFSVFSDGSQVSNTVGYAPSMEQKMIDMIESEIS